MFTFIDRKAKDLNCIVADMSVIQSALNCLF
jgi:hypothetical protein